MEKEAEHVSGEDPAVSAEPIAPTVPAPSPPDGSAHHQDEISHPPLANEPRIDLLDHQFNRIIALWHGSEERAKLKNGFIDLYNSLNPRDGVDSMLAGLIVGLNHVTMDSIGIASRNPLPVRDVNLRHAIKAVKVLAELTKLYESRRGLGRQNFTVGKVNVEAGGQAIVGNVKSSGRRKKPRAMPHRQLVHQRRTKPARL